MISEYAEALAAKLAFDRPLARRVRMEVEDHLREAAARGGHDAERRAIARFGDANAIAAQFARQSLARQARSTGITVLLVLGAILLAMQTRIAWYELTQWAACERLEAASGAIVLIDTFAFYCAALGAIAGWLSRANLRPFFAACALAAGGLVVSVACDATLTAFRLKGWDYSSDFLVPLGSMAIEVVCAAALVWQIRIAARRTAAAEALAKLGTDPIF
jgi:hypothetical protein